MANVRIRMTWPSEVLCFGFTTFIDYARMFVALIMWVTMVILVHKESIMKSLEFGL
jgi:hypothetical protein